MAWKNFQNGYPLYASELNNYLMNQSVATFASSTERASVLTSPVEGQVTWLQDTNAFQVYNGSAWVDINDNTDAIQKSLLTTAGDTIYATGSATPARLALGSTGSLLKSNGTAPTWLGVGTSGQVLSSTGSDLAWSTPATGGMALLSTTTLSGASTTISSISQSYKDLRIEITGVNASANAQVRLATNAGIYYLTTFGNNSGTTVDKTDGYFLTSISTSAYNILAANTQNGWTYILENYSQAVRQTTMIRGLYVDTTSTSRPVNRAGGVEAGQTPVAINSITLSVSTGTFNGGTVKIWGVN